MGKNITLEESVNPCVMCGSAKYVIKHHYDVWIQCKKCGHNGPKAEKLHEAIRKWNRQNESQKESRC